MNLMNRAFQPYQDKFVIMFLDGILVYSEGEEEHVGHPKIVFKLYGNILVSPLLVTL